MLLQGSKGGGNSKKSGQNKKGSKKSSSNRKNTKKTAMPPGGCDLTQKLYVNMDKHKEVACYACCLLFEIVVSVHAYKCGACGCGACMHYGVVGLIKGELSPNMILL